MGRIGLLVMFVEKEARHGRMGQHSLPRHHKSLEAKYVGEGSPESFLKSYGHIAGPL